MVKLMCGLSGEGSLQANTDSCSWGLAGLQRHPDGKAVVDLGTCRPQVCPESQCPPCSACSRFPAAIEWCHRSHKLRGPNVEAEQHFPESGAGPDASAPFAPRDQYLCFQYKPPSQHHNERIEDNLVGVVIVVEWVSGSSASVANFELLA